MKSKLSISILAILLLSCASTKDPFKKVPPILPGFTLLPAPNSLDSPGTIFAVDNNGVRQPLGNTHLSIASGTAAVGQGSGKKESTVATLLSFLGGNNSTLTGNATVNANRNITYKITVDGESSLERIQLLDAQKELAQTKDEIKSFIKDNGIMNYKFYLITEAVKTKKLTYTFDAKKIGDIGVKADLDKIATLNPSVKWDNENNYELSYDLGQQLYAFAKVWALNVETQATGETVLSIGKQVPDDKDLYKPNK